TAVLSNQALASERRTALHAALHKLDQTMRLALANQRSTPPVNGAVTATIFIGHGRRKIYQELVLHLQEEWEADIVFFESEDRTAQQITAVLETMMRGVSVALIVMTGEDKTA